MDCKESNQSNQDVHFLSMQIKKYFMRKSIPGNKKNNKFDQLASTIFKQ